MRKATIFFVGFLLSFFTENKALVTNSSGRGGQVPSVPLSVWKRRRTDRPAAGRAGESERLFVLLFTLVLVLVLVLVFVLLLLLLVLVVVVVVVVAVFGGRSLLSKHGERGRCHWVHSHLQRGLLLPFKIKDTQMNPTDNKGSETNGRESWRTVQKRGSPKCLPRPWELLRMGEIAEEDIHLVSHTHRSVQHCGQDTEYFNSLQFIPITIYTSVLPNHLLKVSTYVFKYYNDKNDYMSVL